MKSHFKSFREREREEEITTLTKTCKMPLLSQNVLLPSEIFSFWLLMPVMPTEKDLNVLVFANQLTTLKFRIDHH